MFLQARFSTAVLNVAEIFARTNPLRSIQGPIEAREVQGREQRRSVRRRGDEVSIEIAQRSSRIVRKPLEVAAAAKFDFAIAPNAAQFENRRLIVICPPPDQ